MSELPLTDKEREEIPHRVLRILDAKDAEIARHLQKIENAKIIIEQLDKERALEARIGYQVTIERNKAYQQIKKLEAVVDAARAINEDREIWDLRKALEDLDK